MNLNENIGGNLRMHIYDKILQLEEDNHLGDNDSEIEELRMILEVMKD